MDEHDVRRAVGETGRALRPYVDRDWSVPAGRLEWSCWQTAAHIAHDLTAYAGQLCGRPESAYLPFDLMVREDAAPERVLAVVEAAGELLCAALAASGPEVRAWHWGPTDPGGFAAMGVAETVLHTHDIARGFGLSWEPPGELCAGVLARLFPDAPDGDPARVLLWATGRGELPGHPLVTSWVWHAAVE